MGAILLTPVYVVLNIYLFIRILKFFTAVHEKLRHPIVVSVSVIIYLFFMLSPLLGFFIKAEPFHRAFKQISNYWLGFLLIGLAITVIADILRLVLNKTVWKEDHPNNKRYKCGFLCVVLIVAAISSYAIYHAKDIKINEYGIEVQKALSAKSSTEDDEANIAEDSLRIAVVSDIHIGYSIEYEHIDKMVERINETNPDIVIIAGDIFDNDYDAVKDPDKIANRIAEIKSKYGVYGCWGNHDIAESLLAGFTMGKEEYKRDERFEAFMQKANVKMLEDESVLINEQFYLVARKDPRMSEKLGETTATASELTADIDKTKPIILVEHEPIELEEVAAAGVDVTISGHTHGGQIFPGTILTDMTSENPRGLLKVGNMYSLVTEGVGVWGPPMRIGTDSEVMLVDIDFDEN